MPAALPACINNGPLQSPPFSVVVLLGLPDDYLRLRLQSPLFCISSLSLFLARPGLAKTMQWQRQWAIVPVEGATI